MVEWSCLQCLESSLAVKCSYLTDWTMNSLRTGWINYGPRPSYIHLISTWCHLCDECSQAFPIFLHSSVSVCYCHCKLKDEKQGRTGNEAIPTEHAHTSVMNTGLMIILHIPSQCWDEVKFHLNTDYTLQYVPTSKACISTICPDNYVHYLNRNCLITGC